MYNVRALDYSPRAARNDFHSEIRFALNVIEEQRKRTAAKNYFGFAFASKDSRTPR